MAKFILCGSFKKIEMIFELTLNAVNICAGGDHCWIAVVISCCIKCVAFFISFLSNPGSKDPSNILFNYKISFLWHSVSLQICLSLYTCNYNSKFHFCDIQFHYRFVSPCTPVQKCNYNSNFHFCDIQFHYRFVSPCTLVITILSLGKSSSMCYYITVIDFLHIFLLMLWVRITLMVKCTRYKIIWCSLSVTCSMSVVLQEYSGFLHQ